MPPRDTAAFTTPILSRTYTFQKNYKRRDKATYFFVLSLLFSFFFFFFFLRKVNPLRARLAEKYIICELPTLSRSCEKRSKSDNVNAISYDLQTLTHFFPSRHNTTYITSSTFHLLNLSK